MDKYDYFQKTRKYNQAMSDNNPNRIKRLKYSLFFKYQHAGQVIPSEEAKLTMELAGQISLLPCVCRFANSGEKHHLCMLFMHIPDDLFGARHFDRIKDVESLTVEEAQFKIDEFSSKGYVQTVWAFITPHIGALCNCDYPYCTALRVRRHTGIQRALYKAEYIASIDENLCKTCKKCISKCQFGALSFSVAEKKVVLNQAECFGCGVCETACEYNAISLIPRTMQLEIKNHW